jgi:hypothetical protein
MFGIILGYLRSGFLEEMSNNNLMKLQVETEYFQISSLQEIIKQRLSVEDDTKSNSKDEVSVIYMGQTFKCKSHALQYCRKELIDQNGDFNARDISDRICPRQRNECRCPVAHVPTLEDLMRRVLRRLEDNRVGDVMHPKGTELFEDSFAARCMGLLPDYPNPKWFY